MKAETKEQLSALFQIILSIVVVTIVIVWLAGLTGCAGRYSRPTETKTITPVDTVLVFLRDRISIREQRALLAGQFHDDIVVKSLWALDGKIIIHPVTWTGNWIDSVRGTWMIHNELAQVDTLTILWKFDTANSKWVKQ